MAYKKFILPQNSAIVITGDAADRLFKCGDGAAAMLYMYILSCGGNLDEGKAIKTLNMDKTKLDEAAAVLQQIGLMQNRQEGEENPAAVDDPPEYTPAELEAVFDSNADFKCLIDDVAQRLDKRLSINEIKILYSVYDWLGLSAPVIYMLVLHTIKVAQDKKEEKKPTVRRIEKTAYRWDELGINTLEKAEEYIKNYNQVQDVKLEILKLLQMDGQKIVPGEDRILTGWAENGIDYKLIEEAGRITKEKIGELSFRYLNTVLTNWVNNNQLTVEQVKQTQKPKKAVSGVKEYKPGQAELDAVKRLDRLGASLLEKDE